MSAGLNATLTKQIIDQRSGTLAQDLNKAMVASENHQIFLASTPDADLVSLGYSPEDVATLKSAFSDADQLRRIYLGEEALPTAKVFTAFLHLIWGTGWSGE